MPKYNRALDHAQMAIVAMSKGAPKTALKHLEAAARSKDAGAAVLMIEATNKQALAAEQTKATAAKAAPAKATAKAQPKKPTVSLAAKARLKASIDEELSEDEPADDTTPDEFIEEHPEGEEVDASDEDGLEDEAFEEEEVDLTSIDEDSELGIEMARVIARMTKK